MFGPGLEHPAVFTAFAGFLLVLVFYLLSWWLIGRDSRPATNCAGQGTPARKISPSAMRFAHRMAIDTGAAAAALMALAARGQLVIEWAQGEIRLRKADLPATDLPAAEAALAHGLLYTRSTLVLHNTAFKVVAPALERFRHALGAEHRREIYRANRGWLLAGIALSGLVLAAAAMQSAAPAPFLLLSALAVAAIIGLSALLQALLPRRYIFPEPLSRGLRALLRRMVGAGFIVVVNPLAFVAFAKLIADPPVPMAAVACVAALAGLHLVVYHFLKAPTVPGVLIRAEIESFRTQLSADAAALQALPVPAGIYTFALDLPGNTDSRDWPPAWLRIAGKAGQAPRTYPELGEMLTRALDSAAMPPAAALFPGTSEAVREDARSASQNAA